MGSRQDATMTSPSKWQRHSYRKFKNVPTERDGLRFDSKKEAKRYDALKALREEGEVVQFLTQAPAFRLPGGGRYVPDFLVFWTDGHVSIEDVKGMRTESYKAKKRIVESVYAPLTIEEL